MPHSYPGATKQLVSKTLGSRLDVRDDETEAEAGNETDGANNEEGQGEAADGGDGAEQTHEALIP